MNLCGIDGPDRCFGVGIGCQQDSFGVGIEFKRMLKEVDAGHSRHPLIGEEEGDYVSAFQKLAADIQGGSTGGSTDDSVALTVMAAQILDDSFQNAGVVVDGEQNWLRHTLVILRGRIFHIPARIIRLSTEASGFRKRIVLLKEFFSIDSLLKLSDLQTLLHSRRNMPMRKIQDFRSWQEIKNIYESTYTR
jgi:hypothetical protein